MGKPYQLDLFNEETKDFIETPVEKRNDVRTGEAAENLVLSKLLKWDYDAHRASGGGPFDLIMEVDQTLLKIQVKSKSRPREKMLFPFTRGYHGSKTKVYNYDQGDFDIACCVNLSDEKILFSPGVQNQVRWSRSDFLRQGFEFKTLELAIEPFLRSVA
jgi:hypothetical protein